MKKSKFTAEQIAYAVRQVLSGTPAADFCGQPGVSERRITSGRRNTRTWA
jgi:hypothetical protein